MSHLWRREVHRAPSHGDNALRLWPRAHRLLKAPPAARAIVESCHVAKTKGLPADVWCHVLGFLRGFDLLEPVLLPTFSLPETYLHTVDLRSMLASVHPAAREDPESDESEENSYGARRPRRLLRRGTICV